MEWIIVRRASNEDELMHYGVKGMKWGTRRYRKYDGSYTRAGVKRFDESLDKYEKADARYKKAKTNYKNAKKTGDSTDGMKTELTNARLQKKQAKIKLTKDYKHLRQDKLGDKGKELYSKGKTITGNNTVTNILETAGGIAMSAAVYNYKNGTLGNKKVTNFLAGIGAGTLAVAELKRAKDYSDNKKLRAYYSHTSNY